MKKILVLLFVFILVLSSCTKKEAGTLNSHETMQKIITELQISPDDIAAEKYYGAAAESENEYTNFNMLGDFKPEGEIVYTPDMFDDFSLILYNKVENVSLEVVIFKVKQKDGKTDTDMVKEIENMCKNRIISVKGDLVAYIPERAAYADNAEVITKGDYVYYVVAEDPDKYTGIIDKNLK